MDGYAANVDFVRALARHPAERSNEDVLIVYAALRRLDVFRHLGDGPLRAICRSARYERHTTHQMLFRKGEISTCWYILLSGSVFIEGQMYLPRASFGKRSGASSRRTSDCFVLEPSEMIVIDYPDVGHLNKAPVAISDNASRKAIQSMNLDHVVLSGRALPNHISRGSSASSSSSTVSAGSSSSHPSTSRMQEHVHHRSEVFVSGSEHPEDELAGLPEANVDSDEEDDESCPSGDSFIELRDNVRISLEKEPFERTEDDLLVLLDFMQHMPAFANLPVGVKRELCLKMVFAVVEKSHQIVMTDQEQLDSWSVIVNGEVEVILPDGAVKEYHLGDSFGVSASPEPQFHRGQMRTLVDDCQFVLVAQTDFVSIMSKVTEHLQKHTDAAGEIVSETERRILDNREGYVLVKGKPDKLISYLIEDRDSSVDPYYVEDFLLMSRTYIDNPTTIFQKFLFWFSDPALRDKVARLVLLWVNNHFNDFETNSEMMQHLEEFEQMLEIESMQSQQTLLNIACSVQSKSRTITYTRSNREEILHFSVLGGYEKGYGIFVSKVEAGSQAEKVGLKRGDEILTVNSQNFQHIPHQRALEILRATTHLSITVKSNLLGFKEMLAVPDKCDKAPPQSARMKPYKKSDTNPSLPPAGPAKLHHSSRSFAAGMGVKASNGPTAVGSPMRGLSVPPPDNQRLSSSSKLMAKLMNKLRAGTSFGSLQENDMADVQALQRQLEQQHRMKHSRSNPDISANQIQHNVQGGLNQYYQPVRSVCPEHVLKIYRADQTFKYLTVYKETTAQNVVQLALQEFGMADATSLDWALCEVKVVAVEPKSLTKQSRLPDQMQNLAERIALNSRYYLKNNKVSDPLVPDDLAPDLLKEAATQLIQLNAQIVAAQLTLQDFAVFQTIEPTEFVDNLFKLGSKYGWPRLTQFETLVNREMWWVATEICREQGSAVKRSKLIKKYIKIARHCRELRNFNSMFAIMSGLEKPAVRRLHQSWEKVSSKYTKMFDELSQLLDPSRNMSKYRQHLSQVSQEPPVVPLCPVIKKDLTFIHEGNPTYCEGLVNFEKLRMIAKEIRAVSKFASAPYDLWNMSELCGGTVNDALIHMNSFEGGSSVATMRRQHQPRPNLTRKKLYEQALMVRKVKEYLSSLVVIEQESELDRISLLCEPAATAGSSGSVNIQRKRMPSPSPSSTSSLSNNSDNRRPLIGPKFGVESPQAVQKMMSLVDHSRIRQQKVQDSNAPPCSPRRTRPLRIPSLSGSHGHNRSTSDTAQLPVDLTAESSSVTTLLTPGLRISSTGSVTSTDSAVSQQSLASGPSISHAVSCDSTDSGHVSMDARTAVQGGAESPLHQRRSYPPHPPPLEQRHAQLAAAAAHHRANPGMFFPRDRNGKGRAPPPPPAKPQGYVNVKVGGLVRRTSSHPENGVSNGEQISRV